MDNDTLDLKELTSSINRLTAEYRKIVPNSQSSISGSSASVRNMSENTASPFSIAKPAGEIPVIRRSNNNAGEMVKYFYMMLGTTKGMLGNMELMDTGFAKTVQILMQILSSITGSSGGGFGGLFSGLLGVIGGIFGGPLGAAAGTDIGGIFGRSSMPLNAQLNKNNIGSSGGSGVINQVIIKNPVTFTKAFDVEVRTRSLRGGIDL